MGAGEGSSAFKKKPITRGAFTPPDRPSGISEEPKASEHQPPEQTQSQDAADALFEAVVSARSKNQTSSPLNTEGNLSTGLEETWLDTLMGFFASKKTWIFIASAGLAVLTAWGFIRIVSNGFQIPEATVRTGTPEAKTSRPAPKPQLRAVPPAPKNTLMGSPEPLKRSTVTRSRPALPAAAPIEPEPLADTDTEQQQANENTEGLQETTSKISDEQFFEEDSDFIHDAAAPAAATVAPGTDSAESKQNQADGADESGETH